MSALTITTRPRRSTSDRDEGALGCVLTDATRSEAALGCVQGREPAALGCVPAPESAALGCVPALSGTGGS